MTPKVSSSWASYDGGSEGTTKISSPPERGLSCAIDEAGAARAAASRRANAMRPTTGNAIQFLLGSLDQKTSYGSNKLPYSIGPPPPVSRLAASSLED